MMKILLILACWVIPNLTLETFQKQSHDDRPSRGISCRPLAFAALRKKLGDVGGFNREIVSFDMRSARKNLAKAVISINYGIQRKAATHGKGYRYKVHTPRRQIRPTYELTRADVQDILSDESNCFDKGSLTPDGNLNLCKKCIVSRTLPQNRFPRFIKETVCSSSDRKALNHQGACIERTVPMTFLKKSSNCVLNADGTYSEGWEPYTENVRVGCECEIRQGSYLEGLVTL